MPLLLGRSSTGWVFLSPTKNPQQRLEMVGIPATSGRQSTPFSLEGVPAEDAPNREGSGRV